MATTTPITIRILGDASKAKQTLAQVDTELGGFGNKVGGHMGKIAGLLGGAFAGFQAASWLKGGFDAVANLDRIAAQTASVVKSTGGAAKVTADQVADLADSIERTTGIESESVRAGENMLLTFTNIKNGVGKGNDVFNQATKTLVDMSTAMGSDPQQAAIQLGKALNDPVKGVTALTKVGVTFDDQQKKQIETLVKSGKTMDAQKVILAELNKEFGGSADAFGNSAAGNLAKFKNSMGELQELVAGALLPTITKVTGVIVARMPAVLSTVERVVEKVRLGLGAMFAAFKDGDVTSDGFVGVMERIGVAVHHAMPTIEKVVGFIKDNFIPIIASIGAALASAGIAGAIGAIGAAVSSAGGFIAAAVAAIGGPITLVIAGIAGMIAAFTYAYTHFEGFRNVVDKVVSFVREKFDAFVAWVKEVWPQVQEAIGHIVNLIQDHLNSLKAFWDQWGPTIIAVVKGIWDAISSVIGAAINVIKNVIQFVLAVINGDWGKAWDALKGIVTSVWDGIKGFIGGALDAIVAVVKGVGGKIRDAASGMWDGIKDSFKSALNWVIDKWNSLTFPSVHIPGTDKDLGGFSLPHIDRFEKGGIAQRGLAIVGEAGPELVNFGSASRVVSNDELMRMIAAGGSSQPQVVKNYNIDMSGVLSPDVTPESIIAAIEYAELLHG